MFRKIILAALVVLSLALCVLGFSSAHPIFVHFPATSKTTVFFSVLDGLVRVGWMTCAEPIQLAFEPPSTALEAPAMTVQLVNSPSQIEWIVLGPQRMLVDNRIGRHAFDWQRPWPLGRLTVFGTQLRMWFGTCDCLLGAWPLLAFIRGPVRRFRRRRRGLCGKCGYNLAGNTSGVCPECGSRTIMHTNQSPK